jgi:maleylpyruvate isomerase
MAVTELDTALAGCSSAHRRLLEVLRQVDDSVVGSATALPGWTVGHLLTHLARNADSFTGMFAAAAKGEVGRQYPGGVAQRNADIELGAARSAAELIADVERSVADLEHAWREATPEVWASTGETVLGVAPLADTPARRWREVVVHLHDLAPGLGEVSDPADWPVDFVRTELRRMTMLWASRRPMGLTELPPAALAAAPAQRLAWLLGRLEIDGLGPAGVMP